MTYAEILAAPRPRAEIEQEAKLYRAACQRAAGRPGCAPWCALHDGPVCYSADDGPVVLTYDPAHGALVFVQGPLEELTPDAAERLGKQLLDVAAAARFGGAV
ncbi:hypothetical protein ACWDUI_24265 [Streptosporangium sandarakinum]